MATESARESAEEQVESLIDDLIRQILSEPGASRESSPRGMAATAGLFESLFGGPEGASRISTFERTLVIEALAAELADALAPALAEQLAPRLLQALEQFMTAGTETEAQTGTKKPASPAKSSSQSRKPDGK